MTCISWDGRHVMADSMATNGAKNIGGVDKLVVRGDHVFGLTGAAALFDPMIGWYIAGADPLTIPKGRDAADDATLFVFNENRAAFYKTELPYAEDFRACPMAWGIGAEFVLGALDAGADLKTAMEIAIKRSVWLGGPVQIIDLQSLKAEAVKCKHTWDHGRFRDRPGTFEYCTQCGESKGDWAT